MSASPSSERRRRVLIADDNPQLLELLEAYLEPLGVEVTTAMDGQATLEAVEERPPDVILLDVMMPKRSGFEVCQTLKQDERFRQIAIVMVTALNELGDLERGRESGADEFLSKPVNKHELLECVRRLLDAQPGASRGPADADGDGA